jgi:predicted RNase H-like nuclease
LRGHSQKAPSVEKESEMAPAGTIRQITYDKFIGADGCPAGWFYVGISSLGECDFGVFKTLPELWQAHRKNTLILADIPIGLPSPETPARQCDRLARNALSPLRHSSVFSPPCRKALSSGSYETACSVNHSATGRRISRQAWGLCRKIREVDNLLQCHPKTRNVIRECHPELCFYGLNGGRPMAHYKKEADGLAERLALLDDYFDKSRIIFNAAVDRFKRKDVARDDIVDALAAAVTGFLSRGDLATLPEVPEIDRRGRPMEMAYFPCAPEQPEKDAPPKPPFGDVIGRMLERCGSADPVFPATELYNETWMLRLVLDWFAKNAAPRHSLSFSKGCRWFSEGLIPTPFRPRHRKDPLGESRTHADGIVGHFEVGRNGKADVQLSAGATHLVCLEAKMFSRLSAGVRNAGYHHQAARYLACMAEMIRRANRPPKRFKRLGFYVLAPADQIAAGVFASQVDAGDIRHTVKRRVSAYSGEKDLWFEQWFLPALDRLKVRCLSWESIVSKISQTDLDFGGRIQHYYKKCLEYNGRKGF